MKLTAIIIDDESAARSYLAALVNEFISDVEIIGTANNVLEGIKLLRNVQPSIIFLDIEMPNGNGFDFLEAINAEEYKIVFTTAYRDFALEAFKYRADGYLLKPIDIDDLESLLDSFKLKINSIGKNEKRIAFKTLESIEYANPEEIIRAEGDGNYTSIFLTSNKKIVVSKNMKQIEEILSFPYFIKTHKSFLINTKHILRFIKTDGGAFEMTDGSNVPVSRRKKDDILKYLDSSL